MRHFRDGVQPFLFFDLPQLLGRHFEHLFVLHVPLERLEFLLQLVFRVLKMLELVVRGRYPLGFFLLKAAVERHVLLLEDAFAFAQGGHLVLQLLRNPFFLGDVRFEILEVGNLLLDDGEELLVASFQLAQRSAAQVDGSV